MRNALSCSLFAGLLLLAAGCSGGSSDDSSSVRIKCIGGQSFCIISCDLGCSQTGCSVSEIAENQRLHFKFSDRVDPLSVNSGSVAIRTATGVQPDGEYLVSDAEVVFVPRINTVNGVSTFGFLRNETYIVTLAGGPTGAQGVRSLSGDPLTQEFTCSVRASLGVVDIDQQPPSAILLSPTNLQAAPLQPTITLRFSELIDTTALQSSLGPASPIRIVLRNTFAPGQCDDGAGVVLTGVPTLSTELVEGRPVTVVQFIPATQLPGEKCVTVYITSQVRDLSGRSAVPAQFQFFTIDATTTPFTLTETFANSTGQDPLVSGGTWNVGARPGQIGGNGRHGSFDVTDGIGGSAPSTYVWNTDNSVIPASQTLSGALETVSDGRYFFTDFVLPAGTTLKFTGSRPAQIFVRGKVDIQGIIDANAEAKAALPTPTTGFLPLAPDWERQSSFNARQFATGLPPVPVTVNGQPGGAGGPGGGRGGDGGRECIGPAVTEGGIAVNDGQPGWAVQLLAGHAYAGSAGSTAGLGSALAPAGGAAFTNTTFILVATPATGQVRRDFSRGGSGGGFSFQGAAPSVPSIAGVGLTQPFAGPAPNLGAPFFLFPYPPVGAPPGYQSLNHFLVGGSGGGGGGSHNFGTLNNTTSVEATGDSFSAGHGGTGGGGAVAIRAGGDVTIASSTQLLARGGLGVFIIGDDPGTANPLRDNRFGLSSPGGGGSGGSFLLQSGRNLVMNGTVSCRGSQADRAGQFAPQAPFTALAPPGLVNVVAIGGAGAHGFYRYEALGNVTVSPASAAGSVPSFNAAEQQAVLTDRDANTGDRSKWYPAGTLLPPTWLYYELDVDTNGDGTIDITYTDNPNAPGGQQANDPINGPVYVRFQGAEMIGTVPAEGPLPPWRQGIANPAPGTGIAGDDVTGYRFELIYNTDIAPNVVVKAMRVFATT